MPWRAFQGNTLTPLLRHAFALTALALATHAAAQVTLFGQEGFSGRSHRAEKQINNLQRMQMTSPPGRTVRVNRMGEPRA